MRGSSRGLWCSRAVSLCRTCAAVPCADCLRSMMSEAILHGVLVP